MSQLDGVLKRDESTVSHPSMVWTTNGICSASLPLFLSFVSISCRLSLCKKTTAICNSCPSVIKQIMTPSNIPLPLSLHSSKVPPRKDVPPSSSVHPLTPKYKSQTRQKLYSSASTSSLPLSSSHSLSTHHNTATRQHQQQPQSGRLVRPDLETPLQILALDPQEEEEGNNDNNDNKDNNDNVDRVMMTLDVDQSFPQRQTQQSQIHSPITPLPGSCVFFETEYQENESPEAPIPVERDSQQAPLSPSSSQEHERLTASASAGTARKCQSTDVCMNLTLSHFLKGRHWWIGDCVDTGAFLPVLGPLDCIVDFLDHYIDLLSYLKNRQERLHAFKKNVRQSCVTLQSPAVFH